MSLVSDDDSGKWDRELICQFCLKRPRAGKLTPDPITIQLVCQIDIILYFVYFVTKQSCQYIVILYAICGCE